MLVDDALYVRVLWVSKVLVLVSISAFKTRSTMRFSTFAKSMAGIGGFVAGDADIVNYLHYNLRSQIFAKSLPITVILNIKANLDLAQTKPELEKSTRIVGHQSGLKKLGFDIGILSLYVTPVYMHGEVPEGYQLGGSCENYGIFCSIVVCILLS